MSGSHVGARVTDPDLIDALEAASEHLGSRSEAVRHAIRETYGSRGDGDRDGDADDLESLPVEAKAGYEALRDNFGTERMIEVGCAKSYIAEKNRVPKDSVRPLVFEPLRRAGFLTVSTQVRSAFIILRGDFRE